MAGIQGATRVVVIGVDPGTSGAIASWDGTTLAVAEMPIVKATARGNEIAWSVVVDIFDVLFPIADHAYVERVHSMPKEGVSSAFKFGSSYGGIRAFLAARQIPTTLVTPQQWKKALRVSKVKDAAVARACEIFPKDSGMFYGPRGGGKDGIAEAAMIAWYGYRELSG